MPFSPIRNKCLGAGLSLRGPSRRELLTGEVLFYFESDAGDLKAVSSDCSGLISQVVSWGASLREIVDMKLSDTCPVGLPSD